VLFRSALFAALFAFAPIAGAQVSSIDYRLTVGGADLSNVAVEMRIHGAARDFSLAMVAHPEYDDQYWRYLADLTATDAGGRSLTVTRKDSSTWSLTQRAAGDVTVRYRVRYPTPSAAAPMGAWKAHLRAIGGLIGGPHSFLYLIGAEHAPVHVAVTLPAGWKIVTGLDSVAAAPGSAARANTDSNAHNFNAWGIEQLVDSPMLVGEVRRWTFRAGDRPHGVSYLGRPDGVLFDTSRLVDQARRIAAQTVNILSPMPYERFEFLFEDAPFGALEHMNSVTLAAPSDQLARDPNWALGSISHEFFHIWNEVHLRPAAWIGVRNHRPDPTGELWWSEGVTLYFADLVLRRATLSTPDSTRIGHLTRLLSNWYANPSHAAVSPERTSRAYNLPPTEVGDYTPNMYLQGELLANLLDLRIRNATGSRATLGDAMLRMTQKFSMQRGFTAADITDALQQTCACDMQAFMNDWVRFTTQSPDIAKAFAAYGLDVNVTWVRETNPDGTPAPDLRLSATTSPDGFVRLNVRFPGAPLAVAGFHTGDEVVSLNGTPIHDVGTFRAMVGRLRIGDTLRVIAGTERSPQGNAYIPRARTIAIGPYDRPEVKVSMRTDAPAAILENLRNWSLGR
jgi:predicted metalloprotease with PDZ domain